MGIHTYAPLKTLHVIIITELASVLSWPSVQRFSRDTHGETLEGSQREQFETLQFDVISLILNNVEKQLGVLKTAKRSPFKNNKVVVEDYDIHNDMDIEQILGLFMKGNIFKSLHTLLLRLELALVDDIPPEAEVGFYSSSSTSSLCVYEHVVLFFMYVCLTLSLSPYLFLPLTNETHAHTKQEYSRRVCHSTDLDEGSDDAWPCFYQLLRIISCLCESTELVSERGARPLYTMFHHMAGQAGGECVCTYIYVYTCL
jgi:hypothetical protein